MTLVFYSHLGIVRRPFQDGLGNIRSDDPPTSIGILLFTDYVRIWPKKALLSACLAEGEGGRGGHLSERGYLLAWFVHSSSLQKHFQMKKCNGNGRVIIANVEQSVAKVANPRTTWIFGTTRDLIMM